MISLDILRNYIENNEVVFQEYNGLIEVSNSENADIRSSLLQKLDFVSSIELYQKGDSFIHEPFEDLDNWSTNDDALFLLETLGILICIPRKLAIEHNIL